MPAPILRAAVLCADALQDEEGDFDLQGVFRQIVIEEFPATAAFKVFVMWTGLERRPHTVTVDVKGPALSSVQVDDAQLPAVEDGFYDQAAVIPVEVAVERPGDLYVELRLEGQTAASFFVPVLTRTFSAADPAR